MIRTVHYARFLVGEAMFRVAKSTAQTAAVTPSAPRRSAGPTVIQPHLLKLIAGGSPKGGWATTPLSVPETTDAASPKGGW
jgi:hypothetical protein